MKAISLRPNFAGHIALKFKTKEYRTWQTNYRGNLIIHANKDILKKEIGSFVYGHAICIVNLTAIKPHKNGYEWIFNGVQYIKPIKINGKQRLFNIEDNLIKPIFVDNIEEYWHSLKLIDLDKEFDFW